MLRLHLPPRSVLWAVSVPKPQTLASAAYDEMWRRILGLTHAVSPKKVGEDIAKATGDWVRKTHGRKLYGYMGKLGSNREHAYRKVSV